MNQVLGLIKGAPGTMVSERGREREKERKRLVHWFSIQQSRST
jgi:hypothetical protein